MHALIHRLHNPDLGRVFLRLALGVVFIHAGWLKVTDMDLVLQGFSAIGIPAWLAYFVSYAELISGILLIVGLFTRYVGILLAIIMIVAIQKVHFVNGFGLANGGYEYNFVLLLNSLAMVTLGAGRYSLACLCKKNKQDREQK